MRAHKFHRAQRTPSSSFYEETHRQSTHITLTLRFKVMSKNSYTPIYILLANMRSDEPQQLTEVLSFVGIGYYRLSSHVDVHLIKS